MIMRHTLAAATAVLILAPTVWMLIDRTPPYEIKGVDITPSTVPLGGSMELTFHIRRLPRTSCGPGLVYREFIDSTGKIHVFDPVLRATPPEINQPQFSRRAQLPEGIATGLTQYRGMACYNCNPLHSWLRWPVCTTAPPTTFTIE